MNAFRFSLLATLGLFLLMNTGCEITFRGCLDPEALNFDATADEDDGSCLYEGQAVFWYDASVAEDLDAYLSDSLTFYIDGEPMLTVETNTYWLSAPDCGLYNSYTITAGLEAGEPRVATYQVIDNFDDILWDGVVAFNNNGCTAVELN